MFEVLRFEVGFRFKVQVPGLNFKGIGFIGAWVSRFGSLLKNKVHRQHQEHEADEVIDPEGFCFEEEEGEDHEYDECDHFLDYFQLYEGEGAAVLFKAQAVCRYL